MIPRGFRRKPVAVETQTERVVRAVTAYVAATCGGGAAWCNAETIDAAKVGRPAGGPR